MQYTIVNNYDNYIKDCNNYKYYKYINNDKQYKNIYNYNDAKKILRLILQECINKGYGKAQVREMLSEYNYDLDELLKEDKFADMRNYFRDDEAEQLNVNQAPQMRDPEIPIKQVESKEEDKLEDKEDLTLCCICLDGKKNVLFLPCKHICTCANCSNVNNCPICRANIVSKIDGVFL